MKLHLLAFNDFLARYRAVFAAAWGMRKELAGPQRYASETAFLPAALSLQESPVHPAPRRVMMVIMALFVVATLWATFGHVDVVAVAQGRIVVSDRTKVIQPLEAGVVKAIHVRDGEKVKAGQVLIELDSTSQQADSSRIGQELLSTTGESLRAKALLNALERGSLSTDIGTTSGASMKQLAAAERQRLTNIVQSEWQDISAKLAKLQAEQSHRKAEIATAQALIAKLETTLPVVKQREQDIKGLAEQGFMGSHAAQDRERERLEMERDLITQRARLVEVQAALTETEQSRASYLAETKRLLSDRLTQAELKSGQLKEDATKAQQRTGLTTLTASVAGTVQQLAIHTTGGVVTPAQTLMVIVPDSGEVTAEVVVENKDVGFVYAGQDAEIKLETFAYTKYGTVPATVKVISADAVMDEKRGPIFPAQLSLKVQSLNVDGKRIALSPGLTVTAEIKTGQRRIIEYLLSPVQQHANESLKER